MIIALVAFIGISFILMGFSRSLVAELKEKNEELEEEKASTKKYIGEYWEQVRRAEKAERAIERYEALAEDSRQDMLKAKAEAKAVRCAYGKFIPYLSYQQAYATGKFRFYSYKREETLNQINAESLQAQIKAETDADVKVTKENTDPYKISFNTEIGSVEIIYEPENHEQIMDCIKKSCLGRGA